MTTYKVTFEKGEPFYIDWESQPRPCKGVHYWFLDFLEKDIGNRKWKTIEKIDS